MAAALAVFVADRTVIGDGRLPPHWSSNRHVPRPNLPVPTKRAPTDAMTVTGEPVRWTRPKSLADTSDHLNWRKPFEFSQEMPRRVPTPKATTKPTPDTTSKPTLNTNTNTNRNTHPTPDTKPMLTPSDRGNLEATTRTNPNPRRLVQPLRNPSRVRTAANLQLVNLRPRAAKQGNGQDSRPAPLPQPGRFENPFLEKRTEPINVAQNISTNDQTDDDLDSVFGLGREDSNDDEANPFESDLMVDRQPEPPALPAEESVIESQLPAADSTESLPPPDDSPDFSIQPFPDSAEQSQQEEPDMLDEGFDREPLLDLNLDNDDEPRQDREDQREAIEDGQVSEFNGRNCAEESADCATSWGQLRDSIGKLTLDITPSIEPQEQDMTKVIEARDDKLAKAPSRTWRNREGQVVTTGRLRDYRNGRVEIQATNGRVRTIGQDELSDEDWCFLTAWWELPAECRLGDEKYQMRDWTLTTFTWTAPAVCHKPLYFEQPQLERYGHSAGPLVQPFLSTAHFFGSVYILPYKMGLNPPNECQYVLGHYRPGNCAPYLLHGVPLTRRAVKWQALALGAAIALFP